MRKQKSPDNSADDATTTPETQGSRSQAHINGENAALDSVPGTSEPSRAAAHHMFNNDDLDPTRWWLIASAFPMIAGALGPVASAFSICALAKEWRQHLPPGAEIESNNYPQPDPAWLIAVNAVQLAMALVSNIFLLLNMARRVRFTIAQPITIAGWYISAICLIALCGTASGPLKEGLEKPDEWVWSQAFYYGVWAAILYFFVATLMVVTFWGAASGHYSKTFVLTPSQRTLMLQTILFLGYLLLGALLFSHIEGWDYLDAVYWANVTLFTVGFGDFAPSTRLGRGLLLPYALVGIISLGLVISSIRRMILDRGRQRVGIRMEEKGRRRLVRTLTKKGQDDVLAPIDEDNSNTSLTPAVTSEYDRRKAEFELMRNIQDRAMSRRRWIAMATSTGTWIALWLIGALIFWETEKKYQPGWGYYDSFYLCFVSLTTIGYGDRTPISNAGKAFFVFWSLLALPTMTVLISNAEDTVVKFIKDATLRLGAITILPRDKLAAIADLQRTKHDSHVESSLEEAQHSPSESTSPNSGKDHRKRHQQKPANQANRDQGGGAGNPNRLHHVVSRIRHAAAVTAEIARPHTHPLNDLPAGREFQLLLISEIQAVTKHLREDKPRRYSFEEWAWFLWLLGEDERNANTHRQALPDEKRDHTLSEEQRESHFRDKRPFKWSWVGSRSPLTADQEESEWVLDRLTVKLRLSLEEERDTQGEKK